MDEAHQGRVHYGRIFVIYSPIQNSNQVLYCCFKTSVILTQKLSINSVNKCSCCGNYIFAELLVSVKLCVSFFNGNHPMELLSQSDPSHYNVR